MNLKWMIDGVSNCNPLWPFCCPNICFLYVEYTFGGILHNTRYARVRSVGNTAYDHMSL